MDGDASASEAMVAILPESAPTTEQAAVPAGAGHFHDRRPTEPFCGRSRGTQLGACQVCELSSVPLPCDGACMIEKLSPCGPRMIAIRPKGVSHGSRTTVAPSSAALAALASVSATLKYVVHSGDMSAGTSAPMAPMPPTTMPSLRLIVEYWKLTPSI